MKKAYRWLRKNFYRLDTQRFKNGKKEFFSLSSSEVNALSMGFKRRKLYYPDNYRSLLKEYGDYENLLYADYVEEAEVGDRRILLIRHDIDHDYVTALKIAKWEYENGYRATYCVLHSAWYYGELVGDRIIHTKELTDFCKRLQDYGHEINFHNNLVATALKQPLDPRKLLEQELNFFESIGVPVIGTSSHGDRLCRELNFRNWELFKECCDGRHGGPRIVRYGSGKNVREVSLGQVSMFDFGLKYEGYDIARDVYHTDSGSKMRTRENTRGRRPFGRTDSNRGVVVGILTHPIWWQF